MVFRRAELCEESDEGVDFCSGLAEQHSDFVQAAVGTIDRFFPPRAHPMANTLVGAQDDFSDGGVS